MLLVSEDNFHKTTNYGQKSSTPRKDKRNQLSRKHNKDDCLAAPIDANISVDFDFESNLALFDKLAVYEEMESDVNMSVSVPSERTWDPKYRCDENILDGPTPATTVYRQIKFKDGAVGDVSTKRFNGLKCRREFVTDTGLIVPSISLETKSKLFLLAEGYGFTRERRSEMIGRSAGEMVLQLLGGSNR